MNSSDVKKRLRDFVNRITVDFDDFNHMSQINRKLDEVEKLVEYIENKIILRIEKAHVEATPSKKVKKNEAREASDRSEADESDAGTDAPSDDGGSDRGE
jgi:hypothetical protein